MPIVTSQGYCHPRYAKVQKEFNRRLKSGEDFGGSIAVIENGETVVDIWGGFKDQSQTQEWQNDTLVNTWSITKTMTTLVALLLVDRGQLDLDVPVARYWPDFAQAGKGEILVRHLLSHTSGLAGWDAPTDIVDLCNIPASTALLAAQEPWWEAGKASGYHLLSFGHLVGEVVRQVTGKTLANFFRDEIAGPLEADFHIGLPITEHKRVAEMIAAPPPPMPPMGSVAFKAFTGPLPIAEYANTTTWRSAGIGGAGGHGNARSMAQIQSMMSHGGQVNGKKFLKAETIELALESQISGVDLVMGMPIDFGLGYGLAQSGQVPFIPPRRIAFWGGAGGSLIINDLDRVTTFAYAMNRMEPGAMLGNENSVAYYSVFDNAQSENA